MAKLEIQFEGKSTFVDIEEEESVLEAGLREGIDLPYSCMSGICTACMAKKVSGDFTMEGAEAIDEDEIKEGKVLTCCTFLKSESGVINYDEDE